MEFLHLFTALISWENSDGGPKCWLFSEATTNTPFDFDIFIHYVQVDKLKLSNTSTTKPTEEKQANTGEEDNGTNMQA